MKERGHKHEELYKMFRMEMEEEDAEKDALREKERKAPIRKTNTDNDAKLAISLSRRAENLTGSTKDDCYFLDSYELEADEYDAEEDELSDDIQSGSNVLNSQRAP